MKLKHFLLTALLLFAGVSGVYAGRRYVGFSSNAPDGQNYSGNTQLQTALNEAQVNDTVFVAVGLYIADTTEFTVKPNVTLIGGYEKGDIGAKTRRYPGQFVPFDSSNLSTTTKFTILDGNAHRILPTQKHRVIRVEADGVVDGCLIRNGHIRNGNGGGVLLDGGKLYNSIVRGNVAMSKPDTTIESLGGGVFIQNGGELINCLVAYNMANDGYGVAAGTNGGKMINNTITANTYSPVFAKIPGGTFQLYKRNTEVNYREPHPTWANGEIPKWDIDITLNDFYLSRIQTTQGQYAVFCAAIDIPVNEINGRIQVDTLKKWPNPIGSDATLEDRYNFGTDATSTGLQNMLQTTTGDTLPGLKYDAGVWHPVGDTATVEYPMGFVSWYGGLAYSAWLGGGLPTQAQWQFAARREPNGVNDNLYSGAYGSTDPSSITATHNLDTATWRILDTIAWVRPTVSIDTATGKLGIPGGTNRPHEVARKRPNAMGIYDMTGNMDEWCADWWISAVSPVYGSAATDPINKTINGYYRITNGGAFSTASRSSFSLTNYGGIGPYSATLNNYGFRLVVAF